MVCSRETKVLSVTYSQTLRSFIEQTTKQL